MITTKSYIDFKGMLTCLGLFYAKSLGYNVCIYPTPLLWEGFDTKLIFKQRFEF